MLCCMKNGDIFLKKFKNMDGLLFEVRKKKKSLWYVRVALMYTLSGILLEKNIGKNETYILEIYGTKILESKVRSIT